MSELHIVATLLGFYPVVLGNKQYIKSLLITLYNFQEFITFVLEFLTL